MNSAVAAPIVRVALDLPLPDPFDYRVDPEATLGVGDWVIVPWGPSKRVGLVVEGGVASSIPTERLRTVIGPQEGLPAVPAHWLDFLAFAARYYHCGLGELALPSVPKTLRTVPTPRNRGRAVDRARVRFNAELARAEAAAQADLAPVIPAPTPEQQAALDVLLGLKGHAVTLLHGVTGSGKTEVYFRWLAQRLSAHPNAQALILVPEIALTPQLAQRIQARFPELPLAVLHSERSDTERASHWLAAVEGRARIVLGTRLAVLTPLPGLSAIVVDEEHDASFKQQEGARYSARDLAIALGAQRGVPVVLGSATPSLESWHAAASGRYRRLTLSQRAAGTAPPVVQRIALRGARLEHGLTAPALEALQATLERGEQALVFLNRRGWAPVLSCGACGWLSTCEQCDAYRVLHRLPQALPGRPGYTLVCHHCASEQRVPRQCPTCGNVDLAGLGRGTQRLEEGLQALFPQARIGRLDRDVARQRGAAQRMLDAVHAGDLDLLVGTQMLAKGHDFRRLTLVVVTDADAGLFAADFRAPERLFATLMQVAGRAGRHLASSRVLIQTRYPDHPVLAALAAHDYPRFADQQLAERQATGLPPFVHQALLTAQARDAAAAHAFLAEARDLLRSGDTDPPLPSEWIDALTVCDPVPMPLAQLRGDARAQLLIESASRPVLHAAISPWLGSLRARRTAVRWQLVIDPHEI